MTRPQNENMIWCQEDNKTAQKDKNTSRKQNDKKFKLASVEKKQNKRLKEVLVFSSGQCLDASLWCDGVEHCAEDELDCPPPTTTTSLPSKTTPFPERLIFSGKRLIRKCFRFSFEGALCPQPVNQCGEGLKPVETEVETLDGCPYYKVIYYIL